MTNIGFDKQNLKSLSNNVCSFGQGFKFNLWDPTDMTAKYIIPL